MVATSGSRAGPLRKGNSMRRSPRVLLAWAAALIVMLATARVVAGDLGALHRRAHGLGADVARRARRARPPARADDRRRRRARRPATVDDRVAPTRSHDPGRGHRSGRRGPAAARRRRRAQSRPPIVAGHRRRRPAGPARGARRVKDGFQPPLGSVVDVLATFDPSIATGPGSPGQATVVARGAQVARAVGAADDRAGGDRPTSDAARRHAAGHRDRGPFGRVRGLDRRSSRSRSRRPQIAVLQRRRRRDQARALRHPRPPADH